MSLRSWKRSEGGKNFKYIMIYLHKKFYTFVSLLKMCIILGQGNGASWTAKGPTRSHLHGKEKHKYTLTTDKHEQI